MVDLETSVAVAVIMVSVMLQTGIVAGEEKEEPLVRHKRKKDDDPPPPPPIRSWVTPDISTQDGEANITLPEGFSGNTSTYIRTSPVAQSYVIASQTTSGMFTVHTDLGLLALSSGTERRDYETGHRFEVIQIEAKAPDDSTATATVTIWTSDVNDEVPTFSPTLYRKVVHESTPSGATITRVSVVDRDFNPEHRNVIMSITGGDPTGLFTVYDDGMIKVAERKDLYNATAFYLTVKASDGLNEGTCNVIIGVCGSDVITGQNGCDIIYPHMTLLVIVLVAVVLSM